MNKSTKDIIYHFKNTYSKEGVWRIEFDQEGNCVKKNPAIPDFGDISPFLILFDEEKLVKEQFNEAKKYLKKGIYEGHGNKGLFYNHDWLLGVIDAYRQTNDNDYLDTAIEAVNTIQENYILNGIMTNTPLNSNNLDSFLGMADPYNGGYVELFLELYNITNQKKYLELSETEIRNWSNNKYFIKNGLFPYIPSQRFRFLNPVLKFKTRIACRLFKSNTNLVYSIISIYEIQKTKEWKDILIHWLSGFEKYLFNQGKVNMFLSNSFKSFSVDLKGGFSAFDVLCDLHYNNIEKEKTFSMAKKIYDYWDSIQWENGLWPVKENKNENHLDANVDFAVTLTKFYAITKQEIYWHKFLKARDSIKKYHKTKYGYVNSVNSSGKIVNGNIKTKYQSLLIKLELFPEIPVDVYKDEKLKLLVRDR